jgi:uncharacterized protein YbaP (TraB family)
MILSGHMRHRLLWWLSAASVASLALVGVQAQGGLTPAMVWTVSDASGSTAHLIGSIHALTPDVYPLPTAMDDAFSASKVLVEEILLDEAEDPAAAMKMLKKAALPQGMTLQQLVSESQYAQVNQRAGALGIPMPMVRQLKPWMTAIMLSAATLGKAGFDPAQGIDRHFFDRAKAKGMPVRALESFDFQIDRLDGLSMDDQVTLLAEMVSEADVMVRDVRRLVALWRAGDAEGLAAVLRPSMASMPGLEERLLTERNRDWVPHIERCVREREGCLVVVGAAHLVGHDSVVSLLQARGLTVRQHGVAASAPAEP